MKNYVKPQLFYERYELSQHVAACDWDLNNENENVCGFVGDSTAQSWLSDEYILLNDGRCNFHGSYCYQNADGGENTFRS